MWECNDSTQQDWYYQPVNGTDAVIKNTRAGSGFCLDANVNEIGQNGTHVTLWGCNGSTQQLWRGFGGQTITNVRAGTGFCLDANVHSIAQNGTPMSLWGCNASSQQHWYLSVPYTRTCKNQGFTKNGRADFSSTGGNGIHVDIINASLSAVNVGVTFTNGNQVFNGVIGGGGQTTFAASSSGNTPLTYFLTAFLGGPNIGTVNFTVRSSVC